MKILDALVSTRPSPERRMNSWPFDGFAYNGRLYPFGSGFSTTYGQDPAEPIDDDFVGYVWGALRANATVAAVESVRVRLFSEARFQFRRLRNGRPGDLFGDKSLARLEQPWPGGTTGDLLARMILHADFAGNAYVTVIDDEMVCLRPDWTQILLAPRRARRGRDGSVVDVGYQRVGYAYYEGGATSGNDTPAIFLPSEVAHFAPSPDPLASYRGMAWLTPVVREIQADSQATKHKLKFFENAATPNLAVSLPKEVTPEQFEMFIEKMDAAHSGSENAYKTLYTGGGADVTVVGANIRDTDVGPTQGKGETRIAAAAGVHPVIAGLSEGLAGSSLNAGNFASARRLMADGTFRPLWRNAAGSLSTLVPAPASSELWVDTRDIAFLREDEGDAANIQMVRAQTVGALITQGFTPESAIAAVDNDDFQLLEHTGLVSVQLQPPGGNPAGGDTAA
jgi:hypothetical protein